jgi:hypothetical protein
MRSRASKAGNLRLTLVILLVLFSTALVATNVLATTYSGEATVPAGEHWSQRFEVESFDRLLPPRDIVEINYRFGVLSGPRVDFLLFTDENYSLYNSGENATYIPSFTELNDDRTGGSPYLEPGVYYFVVDNSDYGEAVPEGEPVTFEYRISYQDRESYETRMLLLFLIPAIGLVAIIVIAILVVVLRKEGRGESIKPPD